MGKISEILIDMEISETQSHKVSIRQFSQSLAHGQIRVRQTLYEVTTCELLIVTFCVHVPGLQ